MAEKSRKTADQQEKNMGAERGENVVQNAPPMADTLRKNGVRTGTKRALYKYSCIKMRNWWSCTRSEGAITAIISKLPVFSKFPTGICTGCVRQGNRGNRVL